MAISVGRSRPELVASVAVVGCLIAYTAAVYAIVVVLLGRLTGAAIAGQLALTFLAVALVAFTAEPLANRLRQRLPRSAAERLALLSAGDRRSGEAGVRLTELARLVTESFATAHTTQITASLGGPLTASWQWQRADGGRRDAGIASGTLRQPVIRGTDPLGEIVVHFDDDHDPSPIEQRLLADAADQAALVIMGARMDQTLRQLITDADLRYRELQDSRRRILDTMETERRRVERDIHDGAQQHLVALAVNLRLLKVLLTRDTVRARATAQSLQVALGTCIATLQQLSSGLYPPALLEAGPAAALEVAAQNSPIPVIMNGNRQLRWTPAIEQAVYFSCLEALQNAIKHGDARRIMITISGTPGVLDFEVSDDGRGFDPALLGSGSGTANLADRIAAVGGRLEITTGPGLGTTIRGSIPMHDGPVSQSRLDSPASLVAAP